MFKITGKLKMINDEQVLSERFKKREFVLTDFIQYPQDLMFQLTNENCNLINNFAVGDEIEVFFNLRGKEWINPAGESKYFNSFDAWKVQKMRSSAVEKNEIKSDLPKGLEPDDNDVLPF